MAVVGSRGVIGRELVLQLGGWAAMRAARRLVQQPETSSGCSGVGPLYIALETFEDVHRVVVGARSDAVGSRCASPMMRWPFASAAWVSPRSSIRNAACSWK